MIFNASFCYQWDLILKKICLIRSRGGSSETKSIQKHVMFWRSLSQQPFWLICWFFSFWLEMHTTWNLTWLIIEKKDDEMYISPVKIAIVQPVMIIFVGVPSMLGYPTSFLLRQQARCLCCRGTPDYMGSSPRARRDPVWEGEHEWRSNQEGKATTTTTKPNLNSFSWIHSWYLSLGNRHALQRHRNHEVSGSRVRLKTSRTDNLAAYRNFHEYWSFD